MDSGPAFVLGSVGAPVISGPGWLSVQEVCVFVCVAISLNLMRLGKRILAS